MSESRAVLRGFHTSTSDLLSYISLLESAAPHLKNPAVTEAFHEASKEVFTFIPDAAAEAELWRNKAATASFKGHELAAENELLQLKLENKTKELDTLMSALHRAADKWEEVNTSLLVDAVETLREGVATPDDEDGDKESNSGEEYVDSDYGSGYTDWPSVVSPMRMPLDVDIEKVQPERGSRLVVVSETFAFTLVDQVAAAPSVSRLPTPSPSPAPSPATQPAARTRRTATPFCPCPRSQVTPYCPARRRATPYPSPSPSPSDSSYPELEDSDCSRPSDPFAWVYLIAKDRSRVRAGSESSISGY